MNPATNAAKQRNTRRILDYIINNGETSRVTLAGALALSPATITNIVGELIDNNLLYESRREHSNVGRKTTLLQFRGNLHYVVTIEIATNRNCNAIKLKICDFVGNMIAMQDYKIDVTITTTRTETIVLKELISAVQAFIRKQAPEIVERIYGVGVCVGGMVNSRQCIDAPLMNWKNTNLAKPLQAALHLPVFTEGVTRILARYEMRFIDSSEKNVLYLNTSTGVGMVNFFNGKMVMGKNGIAGEAGHISLNIHGPECFCGNRGCFEYYCGMSSILDHAAKLLIKENENDIFYDLVVNKNEPLTAELLFRANETGSLVVHELLCNVAEYLGAGIAALYNIYDPDRLIFSGYLDGADTVLIENARAEAGSRIVNRFGRDIVLTRAHLGSEQIYFAICAFMLTKFLDRQY